LTKKHISKSNAQRCKEYRQRKKKAQLAKDAIELQLEAHINELKQEEKTEQRGIKISALESNSREPQDKLTEQFQVSEEPHYSLWGELEGTQNPLDKVSHQQNLKNIFGNRAE
jgi:hypothetical protein